MTVLDWREINESLDLEIEDMSIFIEAVDEKNAISTSSSNSFVREDTEKSTTAVTVAESNDSQHSDAIATVQSSVSSSSVTSSPVSTFSTANST